MTWALAANPDAPSRIDLILASATATPTRFRALRQAALPAAERSAIGIVRATC